MAITQKPTPLEASEAFNTFVNKGGRTAQEGTETPATAKLVIRLPIALKRQVDDLLAQRPVKISRHLWIVEAIQQRWEREHAG